MASAAKINLPLINLPLLSCQSPPSLAGPNRSHPPLLVKYTRNPIEANEFIKDSSGATTDKIYGWDIEWKVSYAVKQRPTALLQLCDGKTVYLFHLCHMHSFPSALRELLEDPTIQLSGVGINGDAQRLQKDYGILCAGLIELGPISVYCFQYIDLIRQEQLHHQLPKGPIRISNWEALPLSMAQVDYAANDALASYLVYQKFRHLSNLLPDPIALIDFESDVSQQNPLKRERSEPGVEDSFADDADRTGEREKIRKVAVEETPEDVLNYLEKLDPVEFDNIFGDLKPEDEDPSLDVRFDITP